MESLRDVKRVMEREIEKGSCPLQFEYLEFGEKPFQFIESEEKLNEVLSYLLRLGEYRGYLRFGKIPKGRNQHSLFSVIYRHRKEMVHLMSMRI